MQEEKCNGVERNCHIERISLASASFEYLLFNNLSLFIILCDKIKY